MIKPQACKASGKHTSSCINDSNVKGASLSEGRNGTLLKKIINMLNPWPSNKIYPEEIMFNKKQKYTYRMFILW